MIQPTNSVCQIMQKLKCVYMCAHAHTCVHTHVHAHTNNVTQADVMSGYPITNHLRTYFFYICPTLCILKQHIIFRPMSLWYKHTSIYLTTNGHVDYFYMFAIRNNASINSTFHFFETLLHWLLKPLFCLFCICFIYWLLSLCSLPKCQCSLLLYLRSLSHSTKPFRAILSAFIV